MFQNHQHRKFLFLMPLLVNFLIVGSGVILAPTYVSADNALDGQQASPSNGMIALLPASEDFPEGITETVPAENLPSSFALQSYPSSIFIPHTIYLKSREFQPTAIDALDAQAFQQQINQGQDRIHILVQLDYIPRETARKEMAARGLNLLAYVPDYAWIASVSAASLEGALAVPGVTWAGELTVDDKLDPAIQANQWGTWNLTPDGQAAVYLALHKDESFETGRQLVKNYGGQITGEVIGINLLIVEMPEDQIRDLAAEDAVQWIEPAAPPLSEGNDGIRDQIGVNTVNAAPYNLDGTGIDVLVYDSGQVGNHTDFGTRLTHGDADSVSEHSTHVAGTVGGSGANSATQGGSALQWRGMAPAVDLISYGTGYSGSGITFYENVPDIEADWAAAQNTYGADLGTASLGSNLYAYFPDDCYVMGNYGASSVLIDQIVRGGNSAVGIGDKYIATWAAGNERGWASSCGTYNIVAPPAGAKNPIHVGGSNTNNNTQYAHTSWGPTDDGRIKPIVTAGACQTSGDGGIKSTDNSPLDAYTVMCGTSMATPAVSGGIALMLQHYRDVYNTSGNFWPSTAKAILMQTANDFGNPGPDYQWGYGQVDIQAAVDLISRKAFRQESIVHGEVDVFYFIVPPDADPATVTLAWDDFEATFNANPTLINNLNLELVAPDGTLWRPWVLNPASPTANATRNVDNFNNQEQVQVPTPEVGTWIVRVKGTNVPQGPQDYSLVCEGCKPLNVGVCQVEVSGSATAAPSETGNLRLEENLVEMELPADPLANEELSTGELWQRSLEAQSTAQKAAKEAELQRALEAFEAAREKNPEAVVALTDVLRGESLDILMDEIIAAQEQLAELAPPPPETDPISEVDELATLEAQQAIEATNRARALTNIDDPAEGQASGPSFQPQLAGPDALNADRTVGSGCTYATIAAAIAAADPGDRLLIEGGVTFVENITIDKELILQGGYSGCASGSTDRSTLDGNASGSAVIVNQAIAVSLENLNITNGVSGVEGGGIRFAIGTGTGSLQLTNVQIYGNQGFWGGGLWVGPDAEVTGENVAIYNNTATSYGGGVRLYGGRATFSNSNIYNNNAPSGGGVYATLENSYAPQLNFPSSVDLYDNQALTGTGFGGGVYIRQGTVSLADCSDIYSNDAIDGGGTYLITSTLTINGSCSEIQINTATGNGGGIYAQGSTVNLDDRAELYNNDAGASGIGSGGGAYLDNSSLWGDVATIHYNVANDYGGGVYAINGSTVDMDLDAYTCLSVRCSRLYANSATSYGGGIYALNSTVDLRNTFIEGNTGSLGGGLYTSGSTVYAYNDLIAENNATSSAGDGIRLYSGTSMYGSGNTLAYNDAGGASTGRAIDLFSSNISLVNSVIWGHSTSINDTTQVVTCSDIQGGYSGVGNLNVDPLFVNSSTDDYHLQNTSPVIDRCVTGVGPDFEKQVRPLILSNASSPYDMGADEADGVERVGLNGSGCSFSTIQQAVDAASNGDTLQVAEGVYFESIDITGGKDIDIEGGYDNTCTTAGSGTTRLEGSLSSGSTLDIYASTVTLRNLQIAWGSSVGGGVDARTGAQVTLDNTDVFNNHGSSGGGIYVSSNSMVTTINNSEVHNNTASTIGGGVGVWGQFSGNGNYSDIYENCAPHGGGFYVPGGNLYINSADTYLNKAADANGLGGGIYLTNSGVATLTNGAYVYYLNQAYDGAGIYADNAQVYLNGGATTLRDNVAANNGGAVYLNNGSTLHSSGARIGQAGSSLANEALLGAGVYALNSTVDFDGGYIINNIAADSGGGIYANNSNISLTGVQVGGTAAYYANQLGSSGHFGAGLYLTGATQATLDNTIVAGNIFQTTGFTYGGGAYVSSSVLSLTNNSSIQEQIASSATDGRGAGIYINNGTVTIDNSQVISNTAGAVGGGIRMLGVSVLNMLNGSVIANNEALNGEGGGTAAVGTPDINIADATLQNNRAGTDGGAIYLDSGTLDFTGGWTLRSNDAGGNGGAVAIVGTADADFNVGAYSLVYDNVAQGGNGGAIYVANTDTVQIHATSNPQAYIYANAASMNGGALYADNGGYFDIYGRVNFDHNWATNGHGGAIYLSGGSKLWLDDYVNVGPELWDNRAYNGNGGAIYASNSPSVRLDGATLGRAGEGNYTSVGSGGAIYLGSSTFDAENCIFMDNQAASDGGAIAAYLSDVSISANFTPLISIPSGLEQHDEVGLNAPTATACNPSLEMCSALYNNLADHDGNNSGYGGSIYGSDSTLNVEHTYFYDNSGVRGGAIFQTGGSAVAEISDSLFYNNTSTSNYGAGIRTEAGTFTVNHVTLADNQGGAGYSQSNTTVGSAINSIAWGNTNDGFGIDGGTLNGTCSIDQSGNAGTNINPQFANPGAGANYHLLGSSPAIDACTTGLPTDLDGANRPIDSDYDMGVFEYTAGVSFTPNNANSGNPNQAITYQHTLTNEGGKTDTFALSAESSQGWTVTFDPAAPVTLNIGASTQITVFVNIPAGTAHNTVDITTVTASSGLDPSLNASVTDTTTVISHPDISVTPLVLNVELISDQSTNRTLTIQNTGTANLNWNIAESPERVWLSETPTSGVVSPASNASITATFNATGLAGGNYTTVLQITSDDPDEPQVDVQINLSIIRFDIYLPLVTR